MIRRLTKTADVVVANLPVAVLAKLGLDYESLRAIKPDIILARISAFGPDGPYSHRLGFDSVVQAMSGAMSLTGFPDAPVRSAVWFEDYGTALHTAFGVMAALHYRSRTGQGQIVDGSLLATGVTFMQAMLAERHVLGIERRSQGNAGFYSGPTDVYRTRDGWIAVHTVGGDMFARWAKLVGHEELIGDPRFADDSSRADHYQILAGAMNAWLNARSTAEALKELEAARVPAGPVQNLDQVLDDPQVRARHLLEYVDYPGAPKPVPLASPPVRLSATPGGIRRRAPRLGEHTTEVLKELGYSDAEVHSLHDEQVV